ncbi:uncharacterized protein isoform X2 [Danio rerio]|uniref:Uncharacterized protein isoform X2 n=1 Tax=Danio rerio TaxID=7955 RepID=A0AC58I6X0_DANRE
MEELMERSDEATHTYSDCLLPPDTDFIIDEQCSPQVSDRLTYLEQRVQMQEDEIQLLKMAIADVLKRLNISEEHTHGRAADAAVRPVSLSLTPRASVSSLRKSSSSTLPSSASSRNYSPSSTAAKRTAAGSSREPPNSKAKSSSSRKPLESKPKDGGAAAAGQTVTLQIFLRPQCRRRTGSTEVSPCPVLKSPLRSPSQYFQICY